MQDCRVLWLCGVPQEVQDVALGGRNVGSSAAWSWVMGHLPPPPGVELHIACPARHISEPTKIEYRGAVFHLFPYLRGSAYTLYRNWLPGFRRVYEEVQPEWVHGWGTEAGFSSSALLLAPNRSVVGIQGILSDYYPHMKKSLPLFFNILNERVTLRKSRRLLAESEYSASEIKKYTEGKVGVVPHPLRDAFLKVDSGAKDKKQVVFLGALNAGKGIKDAIAAFSQAAPNEWSLLCIGRGEPDYEKETRALAKQCGVSARVKMCGILRPEEVIKHLQESPVFLLPTYMDTGPTALKEVLAMGLWPVCYDNSGPSELIGRYEYGSLSPTGDISTLANALRNVLTEEPWLRPDRSDCCIQKIRHDLSRQTVWSQLLRCYADEFWEVKTRDKMSEFR